MINPEVNIKKSLSYISYNESYIRENIGEIFLTRFDLEKQIVSGTFSCEQCGITKGRFDISRMNHVIWE